MSSEPPPKKQKKYKVKYNPAWAKDFPAGPCNANLYAFYCIPFNKSVSCSQQSLRDVNEHCRGVAHNKNKQTINPLSAKFIKWSGLAFSGLAFKGLRRVIASFLITKVAEMMT